MTSEYPSIWWTQITGPRRLTEAISRELFNSNSVIIMTYPDLPWRQEMRYSVEEQIQSENLSVDYIDCKDNYDGNDIGRFLLERFGSIADQVEYRPHKEAIILYLQRKGLLADRVVWIKGIPDNQLESWLAFCRIYKGDRKEKGLFVIETNSAILHNHLPRHISIIKYYDYISKYDTQLFAALVVSQSRVPVHLHQYVTFAVTNLCVTDSEAVVELIQNTDFAQTDLLNRIKALFELNNLPINRGSYDNGYDPHPFYLIRTGNHLELTHRLWKAQVQVAFPLVEEARVEFIRKYEDVIKLCLPIKQYKSEIDDPYDVELGTLVYLTQERDENNNRRLFIDNLQDYHRMHFLHDLRNKLAHIKLCSPDEMNWLLCEDQV